MKCQAQFAAGARLNSAVRWHLHPESARVSASSTGHSRKHRLVPNRRARKLVLVLAVLGLLCAAVALFVGGALRSGFGGAAVVLLLTAGYCAVMAWYQEPPGFVTDIHEPAPPVALPQSPVTEIYDPLVPPNTSLERTRDR
jgi:hypothetical protein